MKRKVWNITVKDNPNRVVMGENDEFYTTDTEAYLVFELEDKNFNPATAVLTLENRNDGSLKNETVGVVDGLIEWEMPQRYIEHFGNWQGQLVYEDTKDGQPELYTSAPFTFVVNAHIGDKKQPSLVEIENWEKFIREGTELIETWEDMEDLRQANEAQRQENYQELLDTGVLQTNINTKLEALEEEYAPKLTEVTAQLAQTMNVLNVKKYVVGDGVADDTEAFINAATQAKTTNKVLHVPKDCKIRITSVVDLKFINLDIQGTIVVDMISGIGVKIGGSSYYGRPLNVFVNSIKNKVPANTRSDSKFSLQVEGVMNANITIIDCDSLRLYADGDTYNNGDYNSDISAISYSQFTLGKIDYFYIYSKLSASKIGWINENQFINGRYKQIEIDGNYPHEQNQFIKPCFEGGLLWIKSGNSNIFHDARTEEATIQFEHNTYKNIVFDSFYPTSLIIEKQYLVTYDYGSENEVVSNLESVYTKYPILDLIPNVTFRSMDDCKYNLPSTIGGRIELDSSLNFFTIYNYTRIFQQIIDTNIVKRFKVEYVPNDFGVNPKGIVLSVKCYDENMQILTPSDTADPSTWDVTARGIIWYAPTSRYEYHGHISNEDILLQGRVKYIKFELMGGELPDNSGFNCKRLTLSGMAKPFEAMEIKKIEEKILKNNVAKTGSTSNRPLNNYVGMGYFDTSLNKPIWCKTRTVFDGNGDVYTPAVWVDSTGATV